LVLGSGRGSRFDPTGRRNKLLERLDDGQRVLAASAIAMKGALQRVAVVLPPHSSELEAALEGIDVAFVTNPRHAEGMGTSIAAGVQAHPDARGWIIAMGDMPFVRHETIAQLLSALLAGSASVVAPRFKSQRGHPVAFSAAHFHELAALTGDRGARALLDQHPVLYVDVEDPGTMRDIDTIGDLAS